MVCGVSSPFADLDFTAAEVTQSLVGNGNDTSKADEERFRPNYMTGETCRGTGGCAPCDKQLSGPTEDGCLVSVIEGASNRDYEFEHMF